VPELHVPVLQSALLQQLPPDPAFAQVPAVQTSLQQSFFAQHPPPEGVWPFPWQVSQVPA
jgi:hypothetical protein